MTVCFAEMQCKHKIETHHYNLHHIHEDSIFYYNQNFNKKNVLLYEYASMESGGLIVRNKKLTPSYHKGNHANSYLQRGQIIEQFVNSIDDQTN